ncbi:hypothetical protein [Kingella denitrificans]|uniref:hypothetical protein n=1 Tax=Kingella denitrificans TaxID=502 RepID=UPI0028D15B69|nr:hypothetical protein [Kingella denitrificans]
MTYFSATCLEIGRNGARRIQKQPAFFWGNFLPTDVQAAFACANLPSSYPCLHFPTK